MLTIKGQGATGSELPIGMDRARTYFFDELEGFLRKIEAVDTIKPLSRPGAYLITHQPMGGLSYMVVMVACLQAEWHPGGMRLSPLDFDLEKVKSDHPTVKGFITGDLQVFEREPGSIEVAFKFGVDVELPLRGALRLLPQPLIQATGDGIMGFRTQQVVKNLFQKVLEDFQLSPV